MMDYKNEFRGLLPLIVTYLQDEKSRSGDAKYYGHSEYEIVGNILVAIPSESEAKKWNEWHAYDATNYRTLFSPEMAIADRDETAVRALVYKQLEIDKSCKSVNTNFGTFYIDDFMLMLESNGLVRAWDTYDSVNLCAELTAENIRENKRHWAEIQQRLVADDIEWAGNEYERSVDEYFTNPR